jgi:predicted Zn-dependent protease with MMP-like domain
VISPGRRDRHGRGLRGRLVPPYAPGVARNVRLPLWRSRSETFDELVLDAVAAVGQRWAAELEDVELVVEDVPSPALAGAEGLVADGTSGGEVPLAQALAGSEGVRPRIVVFRRPIELRAEDRLDLRDLVREVVVDAVAELLGRDPDEVDPGQG